MRTKASVLVAVLWCLALLSLVVISVLHTARLDLLVQKNDGDLIQARYLALAGIEKAKALLYQDAIERRQTGKNHTGALYDAPESFRDVPLGRGQFRIFRRGGQDEGGRTIYGISDEESHLNVNYASAEELGKLYGMTPDIVAAIIDWRDEDNSVTPGGAEAEYYASLQPPYQPRNGPLQTTRELLMVRGVSRELLLGKDINQNGFLDSEGYEASNSFFSDNPGSETEGGWSRIVTVDSSVRNVNAAGGDRVNVQSADESSLTSVPGISSEIAKAIVAYRGQNRLESLADLLEVTAVQNQSQPGSPQAAAATQASPTGSPVPPAGQPPKAPPGTPSGPKVINEDLLMDIADDLTAESGEDMPGAVNINTADPAVLACLPGVDQELARAVVSYRQSSGFFPNVAWLLKVPGMTRQVFKQVAPRVTARSETFRILSEGKVGSTGARKRIQVIVHVGLHGIDTLSYREDL